MAEPLEDLIRGAVAEYVTQPEIAEALTTTNHHEPDVTAELADIDERLASWARRSANGEVTEGEWGAATSTLRERRAALSAQVRRTSRPPAVVLEAAQHPERLATDWTKHSFDQQRAILKHLVESVTIAPAVDPKTGERRVTADRLVPIWRDLAA